ANVHHGGEVDNALEDPSGARDVGAVRHHLVRRVFDLGVAHRAALRALELPLLPGAAVAHGPEHLRDDLPRPGDFHPVTLANVLRLDQVEVVERGGGDGDASDLHGLEHGVRVERAGASHVDPDLFELRDLDFGREFAGDGPAWLAVADGAELGVQLQRVDLHHDAVGAVVQGGEGLLKRGDGRVGARQIGHEGVMRFDWESPRGELLEQLVLRRDGELLPRRFDVKAEDPQAAAAGDLWVELAQRSRGG